MFDANPFRRDVGLTYPIVNGSLYRDTHIQRIIRRDGCGAISDTERKLSVSIVGRSIIGKGLGKNFVLILVGCAITANGTMKW